MAVKDFFRIAYLLEEQALRYELMKDDRLIGSVIEFRESAAKLRWFAIATGRIVIQHERCDH